MPTIKEQAADKLAQSKIIDRLSQFGKVYITGSYALDLMVRKELDINVVTTKLAASGIIEIVSEVMKILDPISLDYRNRTLSETKIRIDGHWLYVKCLDGWKFDIWLIDETENAKQASEMATFMKRLNTENRKIILAIKEAVLEDPELSKTYSGQKVYEAVLDK